MRTTKSKRSVAGEVNVKALAVIGLFLLLGTGLVGVIMEDHDKQMVELANITALPPPVPAPVAVPVPVATNRLSSGIWSGTVIEAGDTTFSITGSSPLIRQHWDGTRRVTTITMDNTNDVVVVTNTVTELDVRIRGHRVRASLPDLPQNDQRKEP